VLDCAQGRGDCNALAADGCENDLRSPEHCGRCGHDCGALPYVAAASCRRGACEASCQPGHADCDGDIENGCETDLTLPSSCGGCQNDCTQLPNVALAECSSGVCTPATCQPAFGDCNAAAADGCERPLRSIDSCGACERRCEPLRAQADCSAGVCNHSACDSGFGDCDGNAENGCESRLDGPNHCGSCATACEAGAPCKNGKCGCVRDTQCGEGEQCCLNDCISTVGTCFPFPCIPGTARMDNSDNCGGCGEACPLFCCGPLF
jgi:hypothetical protein